MLPLSQFNCHVVEELGDGNWQVLRRWTFTDPTRSIVVRTVAWAETNRQSHQHRRPKAHSQGGYKHPSSPAIRLFRPSSGWRHRHFSMGSTLSLRDRTSGKSSPSCVRAKAISSSVRRRTKTGLPRHFHCDLSTRLYLRNIHLDRAKRFHVRRWVHLVYQGPNGGTSCHGGRFRRWRNTRNPDGFPSELSACDKRASPIISMATTPATDTA